MGTKGIPRLIAVVLFTRQRHQAVAFEPDKIASQHRVAYSCLNLCSCGASFGLRFNQPTLFEPLECFLHVEPSLFELRVEILRDNTKLNELPSGTLACFAIVWRSVITELALIADEPARDKVPRSFDYVR